MVSNLVDGSEPRMVTFVLPLGAHPGTSKGTMLFLLKESTYQSMFADAIDGEINTYIFSGEEVLSATEDLEISPAQAKSPRRRTGRRSGVPGERTDLSGGFPGAGAGASAMPRCCAWRMSTARCTAPCGERWPCS